jgi:ABC-type branched-subunit amino acid transport system substrate-binding protein
VAFIEDLSQEGAFVPSDAAYQAVELGFDTATLSDDGSLEVDLIRYDTEGTDGTEIAREIAADPAYLAAFAAPGLAGQAEVAGILGPAGVPLVSLSTRGAVEGAAPGTWLRLVAPVRELATALAAEVGSLRDARRGVCLMDAPADGSRFARAVRRSLTPDVAVDEVADPDEVAGAGCGVVVWTGGGEGAAELASGLASMPDESRPVLVGGPGLRDGGLLEQAGDAAEGAISVCSCDEVSTSLDLAAQRFIQDYQSQYGSPPGPYAVEAWDAAHLVARTIREGGSTREALVAALATTATLEGLGGPYTFAAGELADPLAAVRRYRVEGGRWVAVRG